MALPEGRAGPPDPGFVCGLALRAWLTESERAELLGELAELWERRAARDGAERAGRWYARQLRQLPLRLLRYRLAALAPRGGRESGDVRREVAMLGGLRADARQAARTLGRSPLLALTIVVTVGLGLGASTAMFAVVRAVLVETLPYRDGARLVRIYHAIGENRWNLSVADYQAIAAQQTQFEGVDAYATSEQTLTLGDRPERVRVRAVTPGWFDLLGVRAVRGRTFRREDGAVGEVPRVVVSRGFAERYFGGIDGVLDRVIHLDGRAHTVIGVLPAAAGPLEERHELFPVLQLEPPTRRGPFTLTLVGRLRPGADAGAAAAELRAISRRIFPIWQTGWQDATSTYGMMPLADFVVGRVRTLLLVLLGAVALILLVASTNAASLLTARAVRRRTELATRAALGATRARLARLLVTESVVLASAGALAGLLLAAGVARAIRAAGPDLLPRAGQVVLDAPVLAFMAVLAALSVVVFGLVPAVQLVGAGSGIAGTLRAGARTTSGTAAAQRVRRGLVAAQFAVALPLLVGAALLVGTFLRLQSVDPGFDGDGVLTVRIAYAAAPDAEPARADRFWNELLERVARLPGVTAAGLNADRPPRGAGNINNFDPLDRPTPAGETEPMAVWLVASPGYFEALRIPLLRGRMFDSRDGPDAATISALVDRTWADRIYPGEDPVGRKFYEGGCKAPECAIVEVVGVVENVRYLGLDDAASGAAVGTVYVPQAQWRASTTNLYVRTSGGDPAALVAPIRSIVRDLDPATPLSGILTADRLVDEALAAPRNLAALVLGFALVAVLLAVIGIYGVMSYFVQEHRRDIGIRLVLGGRPASVVQLVIARGMQPVLVGIAVGVVIAASATRFMERLLYGVSTSDPVTIAAVALSMLGVALAACWLPAARAARLDPGRVLRQD